MDPERPPAYNGCTCDCHRYPGVWHIAACCYPEDATNEELSVLSGNGDAGGFDWTGPKRPGF